MRQASSLYLSGLVGSKQHMPSLQNGLHSLIHPFLLNEVKVLLNQRCKSWHRLVEVLFPNVLCGKYSLRHLLRVACFPKTLEHLHDFWSIIWLNWRSVNTSATLVIRNDSSKSEDESFGKFALALEIHLHAWQVARLILGERVKHDARHLMVNVWIVEALKHVCSKLLEFFHRKVEGLHQLIELHFMNILANYFVIASIANNVDTAEICNRR